MNNENSSEGAFDIDKPVINNDNPVINNDAVQELIIQPQWVTTPEQLQEHIASWLTQDFLAIDTEFVRTRTYYAQPGLIQIADRHGSYLIDPVQLTDLRPLGELLTAPGPLKILHSMTEDILLLHRITGELPVHVYDTQIAATFLGASSSLSFQRFVQDELGVLLDKTETRSDWVARPLSDQQILYAAQDVVYLLAAMQKQLERVRDKNIFDFVLEESANCVQQIIANEQDVENGYLRVRGGWELNRPQQRLLMHMVRFRDKRAREKDVPKSWVIDDHMLLQIARRNPQTMHDLHTIRDIKESLIRRYGETLISLVHAADESSEQPFKEFDDPVCGREIETYRKMKALTVQVSQQTGFSIPVLAPNKQLDQLLVHVLRKNNPLLTPYFSGWRKAVVGDELLALLQSVETPPEKRTWKAKAATEWIFCSVFKSSRKQGMYLYVTRKRGCDNLPESLKTIFGEPLHVMDMVLTPVKLLARANAREVLDKIAEQGFYLQMPPAEGSELVGDFSAPNDTLHG